MSGDRPTLASIDLAALRHNFAVAAKLARGRDVIAVVKANAYGHGAVPVARTLRAAGCGRFAVVTVREAVELRDAGIEAELLVLGGVHDAAEAQLARTRGLTPVVHHREGLALLREVAGAGDGPLPVQLEIDTGMRRMGVAPEQAVALLAELANEPQLALTGTFTHFARADDRDPTASLEQLRRFRELLQAAAGSGAAPGLVHTHNSAALMACEVLADGIPEAGAVRPGLMLFGGYPSTEAEASGQLRPVMSVRTRVVAIRDVGEREPVGYGATYHAPRPTRVATLPIGYADGVLRSLGNAGEVWLAGARRKIVGRVSMDYLTVEIGDAPVSIGDEATLFGRAAEGGDAAAGVPVDEAARAAGTLSYELMVRVGERVPRRFIGAESALRG